MPLTDSPNLSRLYKFFNTYGRERLDGLDRSYFRDMSPEEKAEAWDFMVDGFEDSDDAIVGLYLLDQMRAIAQFKRALDSPVSPSEYAANRRADEINRLLMLRYVTNADPDPRYIAMLCEFARSEFDEVRWQFAQSISIRNATAELVAVLVEMIFNESEGVPLSVAIMALMELHGLPYDPDDPEWRSIHMLLRSSDPDEKREGMNRLNATRPLTHA